MQQVAIAMYKRMIQRIKSNEKVILDDIDEDKRSKDAIEKNNIILHAKELLNVWYLSDQICFFKATYRSSCCVAFCSKSVEEIIGLCVV